MSTYEDLKGEDMVLNLKKIENEAGERLSIPDKYRYHSVFISVLVDRLEALEGEVKRVKGEM